MSEDLARSFLNMLNKFSQFKKTNYSLHMLNSEFHILSIVYYEDEGVAISEIAEKLNVSIPSISRSVKSLVEKGLLKRYYDPSDRRTTYVDLTDKGVENYINVNQNLNDFINKVLEKYDRDDVNNFIKLGNEVSNDFLDLAPEYENKLYKED